MIMIVNNDEVRFKNQKTNMSQQNIATENTQLTVRTNGALFTGALLPSTSGRFVTHPKQRLCGPGLVWSGLVL